MVYSNIAKFIRNNKFNIALFGAKRALVNCGQYFWLMLSFGSPHEPLLL